MKLPISDLLDACTADDIELTADINTTAIKAKTLARIHAEKSHRRWKPSVLLAAAIVATLLFGTAVAAGSAIVGRYVEDPSEFTQIIKTQKEDGSILYHKAEHPDACYAITFDFEEPQEGMVYYKLNWLPYPAHDAWPKPVDTSDRLSHWDVIQNDGYYTDPDHPYRRNGEMLYQIRVTPLTDPNDIYFFHGKVLSEAYDTWQGMSRLRLSIDYASMEQNPYYHWDGPPVNYLILFAPNTSILIYIAGTLGFEDLEAIAENMEIKVTDELDTTKEYLDAYMEENPSNIEYFGPNMSWLDLGRG